MENLPPLVWPLQLQLKRELCLWGNFVKHIIYLFILSHAGRTRAPEICLLET